MLEARQGAWVGWDGGAPDVPRRVSGLDIDLHPVALNRSLVRDYYHGFANRTLWPLLHDQVRSPVHDRRWWEAYRRANERFAAAADPLGGGPRRPKLWVHDYHLMLLPDLLRGPHPRSPIAFFLHTPFPAPELFARLPWRRDLLHGLLGADLLAFQTRSDRDNFLRTCARCLGEGNVEHDRIRPADGRTVRAAAHPISIDAPGVAARAVGEPVEREVGRLRSRFSGRKVLLGVDRLDYTKGILERLKALELLLERRKDLRRDLVFVQIAAPSRDDVREYRELRAQVEGEVGRIVGRFTDQSGAVPVRYLYRSIPEHSTLAYYRVADVALVTPLRDGMNLVAKEFVVCQAAGGESGALVLSEFAGAADELTEAVLCNPFDVEGLSYRIEHALELGEDDRRKRLAAMAATVHEHDVFAWAEGLLTDLEAGYGDRGPSNGAAPR
jgi:trehalose 6-phosphate synthase